jgi:hypothetical protein|tara:strand:- start:6588 stop:6863 length:276 start_codon:yes stop_codon:yes gene_type:complete
VVNGKARYTAAHAVAAVLLLTSAGGTALLAQDTVPQILPLDEKDDDVLICDDLDDDGILDLLDNCSGLFNPLQTDDNRNGIGDDCEALLPN